MISRRSRAAGLQLINDALVKFAFDGIVAPTMAELKAKKTRELGASTTASAVVPKVISTPST